MMLPPSTDPLWGLWSRPLAAFLRLAPRTRAECAVFAESRSSSLEQAESLLPFLELEGFAVAEGGRVALTLAGDVWLGDYRLELVAVPLRRHVRAQVAEDLSGREFETRLRPFERAGTDARGLAIWRCWCTCGNPSPVEVRSSDLRLRRVKSCGCLRREAARARALLGIRRRAA